MRIVNRISIGSFAVAVALIGAAAEQIPVATAAPPSMNISASGGDGTQVVKPKVTDSVQGVKDSDGDQDAFDAINSEYVTPQVKSPNKMTK